MKIRTTISALSLVAVCTAPLGAYEGLQKDFGTCLQGQGKATNDAVVAACTRLIDNAKAENELIGFAYAMRATLSTDKASNCRDAKKAVQLVKAKVVVDGANKIIKENC